MTGAQSLSEKLKPYQFTKQEGPYEPLRVKALWVIVPLVLYVSAGIYGVFVEQRLFWSMAHPDYTGFAGREKLGDLAHQSDAVNLCATFLYTIIGISFIRWMGRAHRNLTALGQQKLNNEAGEVLWSFFVPIVALYKPMMIIGEIWKASKPSSGTGTQWRNESLGLIPWFWWLLWLMMPISRFHETLSQRYLESYISQVPTPCTGAVIEEMETLFDAFRSAAVLNDCLVILCAVLIGLIVWTISRNQEKKLSKLGGVVVNIDYTQEAKRRGMLQDLRIFVGSAFIVIAVIGYFVVGLWSIWVCQAILYPVMGNWVFSAWLVAPIVISLAPWYALFSAHDWFPMLLTYGGGIVCATAYALGQVIKPQQQQ